MKRVKLAKSAFNISKRLIKVRSSGVLKKQKINQCVLDHETVIKKCSLFKNFKIEPLLKRPFYLDAPTKICEKDLVKYIKRQPIQMTGTGIAHPKSNYKDKHHSIVALDVVTVKDKDNILIVDLDDTVKDSGFVWLVDPKDIAKSFVKFNDGNADIEPLLVAAEHTSVFQTVKDHLSKLI